ncbi:MAG: hypothetical protein AAGN46_06750 [Acidobacteriota bacterium]
MKFHVVRAFRRTAPTLLVAAVVAFAHVPAAWAQAPFTQIDLRTPLELSAGTSIEDDLLLVAALFQSPNRISVFRSGADGLGPWLEETAVASGDPYFALSRRIECRGGACHFTAVNGTTLDVELFTRSAATGMWSRQAIVTGGVYFSSDLGLSLDAMTVLAYDAVAFEIEIWRSTAGGPFVQTAVVDDAAGAIYGALRSALAADEASLDYLVTYDNRASIATRSVGEVASPGHFPPAPALPAGGPGSPVPLTRQLGLVAGALIDEDVAPVDELAAGDPSTLREAAAIHTCGLIVVTYQDSRGDVVLIVRDAATGDLLTEPSLLGNAPLTQDTGVPVALRVLKNEFPFISFIATWAEGRCSVISVRVSDGFVDVSNGVIEPAAQVGALGSANTNDIGVGDASEINVIAGVPIGGGLGIWRVDRGVDGPPIVDIPSLSTLGLAGFALLLLGLGVLRMPR